MLPKVRALFLSAALLLPSFPTHAQPVPVHHVAEEPSMEVLKSFGCLAGGTTGTIAAIGIGPENLVNLVSGGIVTPASSAVLAIGVAGVVFVTFCTLGEALTPSLLYTVDHASDAMEALGDAAANVAIAGIDAAAEALRATRSAAAEALDATAEAAAAALETATIARTAVATATRNAADAVVTLAADTIEATAHQAARLVPASWAPTTWAQTGWNALADLCVQASLCAAPVRTVATPPAAHNIASR